MTVNILQLKLCDFAVGTFCLLSYDMAESRTVSNSENKRTLPAWMLKATSGNQAAKTADQNKQALESADIGALDQSKPIKRNNRRPLKNLDSVAAGELGVLQRCEGRGKARRKSKDAVKDEVEEIVELKSKNARKTSGRGAAKNSKKRKLDNVESGPSSPVSTDDDIELTVEDLVSIAEEFVNADKQKQCELQTVEVTRHKEHHLCPKISTEVDRGQSVVNAQSVKGSMQCATATSNTGAIKYTEDESTSHQEVQFSSFKTTEDVAQDMINLLFGHLLSKPVANTEKSDPVESTTRTVNQVPEGRGWHSEVPRQEEPVKKPEPVVESMPTTINHVPEKKDWRSELTKLGEPVAKKKSSLRDKVALFL